MYFSFCKILEAIIIYVYISILEKVSWLVMGLVNGLEETVNVCCAPLST